MLTPRMKELLTFIDRSIRENDGICPTYDEMAKGSGVKSKGQIHRLVTALEERGFIQRLHGRHRAIEVIYRPSVDRDAWQLIDTITPAVGHVLFYGNTHHDEDMVFSGYVARNGTFYADGGPICYPSYWMPLPKPPVTQEQS